MPFLYDSWYCVGFPQDIIAGVPKAITVLAEPLLLMRNAQGTVSALHDRCPHRFAPLSRGKVENGEVQCPYHGLRFDGQGRCTLNPHGDGSIPQAARVRSFPVLERHGMVWVWMGDASRADPAALPDFSDVEERPGWARVQGQLRTPANYELINDNLLDLSHVPYLHAFLANAKGSHQAPDRVVIELEQHGQTLRAVSENYGDSPSPLVHLLWEGGPVPERVDSRANMRWDAPSLMLLDSGFTAPGAPREQGASFPSVHLLTPETEHSTHYFFAVARNTHIERQEVSQAIVQVAMSAFGNEDAPMIEACERNMGGAELMSLNPLMLPTDAAALRARRLLSARIEAQTAAR